MSALQWLVTGACLFVLAMAVLYGIGVYYALKTLDWQEEQQ